MNSLNVRRHHQDPCQICEDDLFYRNINGLFHFPLLQEYKTNIHTYTQIRIYTHTNITTVGILRISLDS